MLTVGHPQSLAGKTSCLPMESFHSGMGERLTDNFFTPSLFYQIRTLLYILMALGTSAHKVHISPNRLSCSTMSFWQDRCYLTTRLLASILPAYVEHSANIMDRRE